MSQDWCGFWFLFFERHVPGYRGCAHFATGHAGAKLQGKERLTTAAVPFPAWFSSSASASAGCRDTKMEIFRASRG
jgi:hypothetical protein